MWLSGQYAVPLEGSVRSEFCCRILFVQADFEDRVPPLPACPDWHMAVENPGRPN